MVKIKKVDKTKMNVAINRNMNLQGKLNVLWKDKCVI